MKKQLLIAAVAATMTSAAFADLSISGAYEAVVKAQKGAATSVTQDFDLTIKAAGSAGTAVVTIEGMNAAGDAATAKTMYVTTKIGGMNAKIGDYKGLSGAYGLTNAKGVSTQKVDLGTSVAGFKVNAASTSTNKNVSITLAGKVAGFDVKMQNAMDSARMTSIGGSIAGVTANLERQKTATGTNTAYSLAGSTNGLDITYASIKVNDATKVTANDNIFGDVSAVANGNKATALQIKTASAFGPVTVKSAKVSGTTTNSVSVTNSNVTYKYAKKDATNATISAKVAFKF